MSDNPYSVGEQPAFGDVRLPGPKFDALVRTMQIIAAALMAGVLLFLGVVLVSTQGHVFSTKAPPLISGIAGGFAFLMIVNHFVIPGILTRTQLRLAAERKLLQQDEEAKNQRVVAIYQTQLIIGLALLEGAAFFNLIALMIGKSIFSLGVVVLLLCLMLMKFPTRNRISFWVQDKLRELQIM